MPSQRRITGSTGDDEGARLIADEELGSRARIESGARFIVERGAVDSDGAAFRKGARCPDSAEQERQGCHTRGAKPTCPQDIYREKAPHPERYRVVFDGMRPLGAWTRDRG
jgi:hypothetical protein